MPLRRPATVPAFLPAVTASLAAACLGLWTLPARADNCDAIRAGIDERIRARGVNNFVLTVVDAGSAKGGRVLGTCGSGAKQIVQTFTDGPTPALPPAPGAMAAPVVRAPSATSGAGNPARGDPADKIPTECKDGSIVIGPNCDNPRAIRMTKAELETVAPASAASGPAASAASAAAAASTPAAASAPQ